MLLFSLHTHLPHSPHPSDVVLQSPHSFQSHLHLGPELPVSEGTGVEILSWAWALSCALPRTQNRSHSMLTGL